MKTMKDVRRSISKGRSLVRLLGYFLGRFVTTKIKKVNFYSSNFRENLTKKSTKTLQKNLGLYQRNLKTVASKGTRKLESYIAKFYKKFFFL